MKTIVLGAGGHGRVVADTLRSAGEDVVGLLDPDIALHGTQVAGFDVLGDDDGLHRFDRASTALAIGIGSVGPVRLRKAIYERYANDGWSIPPVVHPSAWVSPTSTLEPGAQVLAGAIVQTGAYIGANAIVNTKASVDHDCVLGSHVHLAPGVTLSGSVRIGECAHVGTGASLVQGVTVGAYSMVAAGAVVTKSFGEASRLFGVPAKLES